MLQSLKRAHKLSPTNPKLHSCLIRFWQFTQQDKANWETSLAEVISIETRPWFNGKDAPLLNKEFLEVNSNSLKAVFEGAKMMYHLDNRTQNQAMMLVTGLDNKYNDVDIEVSIHY